MGEVKSERCQTFFVASSLKGEYGRMSHAQNPSQGVQQAVVAPQQWIERTKLKQH